MPKWRVSDSSDGEEDPSSMDDEDGESDDSITDFVTEAWGAKLNVEIWKPNIFLYPARTSPQSNRLMWRLAIFFLRKGDAWLVTELWQVTTH